MQLLPTGHCFDDAVEYLAMRILDLDTITDRSTLDTLILVHAILESSSGIRYAHAWVEEGDQCWDAGLINNRRVFYAVALDQYYQARQVKQSTRYTLREVYEHSRKTQTSGPWNPEYIALCKSGGDDHPGRILGEIQVKSAPPLPIEFRSGRRGGKSQA